MRKPRRATPAEIHQAADDYVTLDEAAILMRLHPATLRRYRKTRPDFPKFGQLGVNTPLIAPRHKIIEYIDKLLNPTPKKVA